MSSDFIIGFPGETEKAFADTMKLIEAIGLDGMPLQLEALEVGSGVLPVTPEYALTAMPYYLNTRAASIYGGSNEVQRGIIAKAVLGL